jgi:hypothetical protein
VGYSNWSDAAYERVRSRRTRAAPREIFREIEAVDPLMDPRRVVVREARDSEHHPASTPIIVGFDVTASMGHIPTSFAKVQLGQLMRRLVEAGWVRDPQLLFAAIGDAVSDRAPLQVGQFESGLEMDAWLTRIWLEGRGGDIPESYTLLHWFAAHRTATDAWEKRRERGFLFTIGDAPNKPLRHSHLQRVFGATVDDPGTDAQVLAEATERWDCFHVLVTTGTDIRADVRHGWTDLLGTHVLECRDISGICELVGAVLAGRTGRLTVDAGAAVLEEAGLSAREIQLYRRAMR